MKKKRGSCLGALFIIVLILLLLCAGLGALVYFAASSPAGAAGKVAEKVLSPFVSKDIKELVDSTEEFLDEYIEFEKTIDTQNNAEIVSEMAEYMDKYNNVMNEINAIDKNSLNMIDRLYLSMRYYQISEKSLEVQQNNTL